VLDVIEALFMHMFDGLATRYAKELAFIAQQYPFEPLVAKPTRITFAEGIKMLQENG
jgi:aspartyl-tRNA synthetase